MKKVLNQILITVICCVLCIFAYDRIMIKHKVQLEQQFTKFVAHQENKVLNPINISPKETPDNFIKPASRARAAVVSIKAIQIKGNNWQKDKYTMVNGSGVILSSNGYIITNNHVIKDADKIEILLENKREYEATLIGYDLSTDLALLKIDAQELKYLEFGDSNDIQVGEWVLAVGNPFKLQSSVTAGIVSAKARNINIFDRQGLESFIQTDAAINPGNSGGALINAQGYLIGINTAILTYSGKYEGFSFAVPSTIVKKVYEDIREYGAVQRAWLGIGFDEITNDLAAKLDLSTIRGVLITMLEKEGAARKSGLKRNDVVVGIDQQAIGGIAEFREAISQYSPGDTIVLTYFRGGSQLTTEAILQNQINTTDLIAVRNDQILTDLGFEIRDLDSSERTRLNTQGVIVVSIKNQSKISKTNMDPSYIITSLNGTRIISVDQLIQILQGRPERLEFNGFYENWPGDYPYVLNL